MPAAHPGYQKIPSSVTYDGSTVESPTDSPDTLMEELQPERHASSLQRAWLGTKVIIKTNKGLLLVAASQAFLSLMNVSVKQLNSIDPPVSALQLVDVRMIITFFCCVAYMTWAKVPDPVFGPKGVRLLLVFRGLTGFFGLFGVYYSLQYLSLSDATVLTFLAPMCTAVAGALFLKEKLTKEHAIAGFVSLIGVVLIARPASLFGDAAGAPPDGGSLPAHGPKIVTPAERLVAVGVALVGVLGATGAYTSIRAIGKRAHPLHALTSFSVQCIIMSSIGMLATKEKVIIPNRIEWLALFLLIGIFGFIAQILLTMGLQRETAGRGSMAVYTQIVFATIFEQIFFHALPSMLSILGTLLILSSAIYVAFSKKTEGPVALLGDSSVPLRQVSEDSSLERGLHEDRLPSNDDQYHERSSTSDSKGSDGLEIKGLEYDKDQDIVLPLFDDRAR